MFCATVLYPHQENANFDFELYANSLLPEYVAILGDNFVEHEVRKGLATPGNPNPSFICVANIWVKSAELFGQSMSDPRMKNLMEKIASFTDIKPIRQFEVTIE